jgi:signal transduction histidine kinase
VFVILSADTEKIKNHGIGIGIPRIFHIELVFRGKIAAKLAGLGLPLAMKIIRMHEGGVQVQSEKIKEPS